MDCDLVFDLLTRGPVPTGDAETDAAIERHLAACHDCRRLAEAMRPAVDLFHEAISESDSLPCYQGSLPVAGIADVAVLDRPAETSVEVRPETGTARYSVWPFVAACVASLMLGAGLMSLRGDRRGDATAVNFQPTAALRLVDDSREGRLVALGMADDCRPRFAVAGSEGHLLQCCSLCHSAGSPSPNLEPVTMAKSCVVCHTHVPETGDDAARLLDAVGPEVAGRLL